MNNSFFLGSFGGSRHGQLEAKWGFFLSRSVRRMLLRLPDETGSAALPSVAGRVRLFGIACWRIDSSTRWSQLTPRHWQLPRPSRTMWTSSEGEDLDGQVEISENHCVVLFIWQNIGAMKNCWVNFRRGRCHARSRFQRKAMSSDAR